MDRAIKENSPPPLDSHLFSLSLIEPAITGGAELPSFPSRRGDDVALITRPHGQISPSLFLSLGKERRLQVEQRRFNAAGFREVACN